MAQPTSDNSGQPTNAGHHRGSAEENSNDSRSSAETNFQEIESTEVEEIEKDEESGEIASDGDSLRNTVAYSCPVDHSGTTVHLKGWLSDSNKDNPPIVMIHDLGENLGLFRPLGISMAEQGYSSYAFDMRGHGRSGRMLGHISKFGDLVDDLLQVAAWVKHRENRHPPIFIAQGVGALVAFACAEQYPTYCGGLVLAAPSFDMKFRRWPGMGFVFKTFADLLPTMRAPRGLYPKFHQNLPGEKQTIMDAIRGQVVSPSVVPTIRFINELLSVQHEFESRAWTVGAPALAILPSNDKLADYQAFTKKWQTPPSDNREIAQIDSGHRVFVDQEGRLNEQAAQALCRWLHKLSNPKEPGSP